jgi:DNA-binding LacI/PurR family transcriptional regulator
MTREQGRITSTDVARASGVSRATVSYVLNNDPRQTIPPETRERVMQAARELGYRPFAPARILRAGYSRLVLAVLPFEQVDPSLARVSRDLEVGLARLEFSLIWYVGVPDVHEIHPSANLTPAVVIAFGSPSDPELASFVNEFSAPVVWMRDHDRGKQIGRLQVDHLAERGWQCIAFAAPERTDVRGLAQLRLAGVAERCTQLGLEAPAAKIVPLQRTGARAAIGELLANIAPPFGLCCYNDEVAFAALAGLADNGIRVPDAVAVIGCDDIPLAQLSTPALTTIATIQEDMERLLEARIAHILAASRGEPLQDPAPERVMVILRESA